MPHKAPWQHVRRSRKERPHYSVRGSTRCPEVCISSVIYFRMYLDFPWQSGSGLSIRFRDRWCCQGRWSWWVGHPPFVVESRQSTTVGSCCVVLCGPWSKDKADVAWNISHHTPRSRLFPRLDLVVSYRIAIFLCFSFLHRERTGLILPIQWFPSINITQTHRTQLLDIIYGIELELNCILSTIPY